MERNRVYGTILTSLLLAGNMADAAAEPLDIKPGLWAMSVRAEMHGMPPIPEEQLKNMSQQQRSAIENMMSESAKPHTREMQQCITQEDLKKSENLFNTDQPGMKCHNKLTKHSTSVMAGTIDCSKAGTRATGEFTYEAKDREHVNGNVSMTITNGKNTMTTMGTMSGHWLNGVCTKAE